MDGSKERQGDFVFSAKDSGEYRFCFNNEMSTFAEKMVDFEIAVGLGFFWARREGNPPLFARGHNTGRDYCVLPDIKHFSVYNFGTNGLTNPLFFLLS